MSDENLENKFRKYLDSFASEDFINKSRFDIFEAGYKLAMEEIKILKTSRNFGKTAMLDNLYGKQRLKDAEEALRFYAEKSNWGIAFPGECVSIEPLDQEKVYINEKYPANLRGGKRARDYFKKWGNNE